MTDYDRDLNRAVEEAQGDTGADPDIEAQRALAAWLGRPGRTATQMHNVSGYWVGVYVDGWRAGMGIGPTLAAAVREALAQGEG